MTEEITPGQAARNEFEKLFEKDPILKELDDVYHSTTDALLELMREAEEQDPDLDEALMEYWPELDNARSWAEEQISERVDKLKAKENQS